MDARLRALQKAVNTTRGPGWLLVMIETMMSEWHWPLEKAVFEGPLNACQTLWPALLTRHGVEVYSTHADKARQAAKTRMRAHIEEHFTIRAATAREVVAFQRAAMRNSQGER
jgi:hypothetical protein